MSFNGGGYESVFNIALGSGGAYSPGDYLIHPDSYANDKYGKLAFNRISLIPLSVALKDIVGKDAKAS
ncbi:single-stranded DNA-binding protein [Xylella taiwanensis]|uniref:single-stranded DNA-binding protein n=1 Tax=Xylella taiwanensis TaxID=1444770 RepID=UPI002E788721|nr:single-stranded DNA-binding protein [Xylella taiwanensis]